MRPTSSDIEQWRHQIGENSLLRLDRAAEKIVEAKRSGKSLVVVTGSGPNLHEGISTLIAGLIHQGVVDGVITSSAIIAHEMAGTLDRIYRVHLENPRQLGIEPHLLARGGDFELSQLSRGQRRLLEKELDIDWGLYDLLNQRPGDSIIKAAGNMGWPLGLRTEQIAQEAVKLAARDEKPLEAIVGHGCDPWTMVGAGAQNKIPVIVSTPQLVGGGAVGLAIGDSIPISHRARLIARLLAKADIIIESAVALAQEIHDGPFETYTGHGIWSGWQGEETFSLEEKMLVRIDMDPMLERAWLHQRENLAIQAAIDQGIPKAKSTGLPFRMEMSGFARLEKSLPIVSDIGLAWPILVRHLEKGLGFDLEFVPSPQETQSGKNMRKWIVDNVQPLDRQKMLAQNRQQCDSME
jgi:hypothetical protein